MTRDTSPENKSIVRRHRAIAAVAVVVVLVVSAGVAVAATSLSENFEDGDVSDFDGGTRVTLTADDSVGFYGSTSMNMTMSSSNSEQLISWDPTAGTFDSSDRTVYKTTIKTPANTAEDKITGISLRADGNNYIQVRLEPNLGTSFGNLGWTVQSGGTTDELQTDLQPIDANTWYNVNTTVDSGTVYLTVWEAGTAEPSSAGYTAALSDTITGGTANLYMEQGDVAFSSYVDEIAYNDDLPHEKTFFEVSGSVTDSDNNDLEDVTITAEQSGSTVKSTMTNNVGQYTLELENGTYDVTAAKAGYFNRTKTVTVASGDETVDFKLVNKSNSLEITTHHFLEHGETADYTIRYEEVDNQTGETTSKDVTDAANVTSGNTSVLTVNSADTEIVATNDTSINVRTHITAEYTNDAGDTLTASTNVTVANLSVENFDILPAFQRYIAAIGGGGPTGDTYKIILIATGAGVAASILATSFAGIGTITAIMVMGWVMGRIGDGVIIVTVFTAMFIGLNIAGNINYPTQGGMQ